MDTLDKLPIRTQNVRLLTDLGSQKLDVGRFKLELRELLVLEQERWARLQALLTKEQLESAVIDGREYSHYLVEKWEKVELRVQNAWNLRRVVQNEIKEWESREAQRTGRMW